MAAALKMSRSTIMAAGLSYVKPLLLSSVYIAVSASLINFNKFLMKPNRFPHAAALTTLHMIFTMILSTLLYLVAPNLYPTMGKARANLRTVLSYMMPLGCLFACALYFSNKAYQYSTVAFLQFCKEGNIILMFGFSCAFGLVKFSWDKAATLLVMLVGCTLCIHGEIHFVWLGLVLQLTSQIGEVSKNIITEIVTSKSNLKLDVLTFVSFQAPCSLVPLLFFLHSHWTPAVVADAQMNWHFLIISAMLAFSVNLLIAQVAKTLSALAFVIIGLAKDIIIVCVSAVVMGEAVSSQQVFGFGVTLIGMALWGYIRMSDQDRLKKNSEAQPLVSKKKLESA
eukprot:TRINITY_DN40867_c0_g1_i1.p1 TRINITY_DN40867_c0_g1~~TRINITY_DN40867_c0_g1_i1.p1  ORF type:complete len:374 (-),score=54.47 TRINITY_DN40867_c0_g1_i1:53-1069(-)